MCRTLLFTLMGLIYGLTGCKPTRVATSTPADTPQNKPDTVISQPVAETPKSEPPPKAPMTYLEALLAKYPDYFDAITKEADSLNIQIIYTRIDRDANNQPSFKDYSFRSDPGTYFYPASTVKLPIAILALQRLRELKSTGVNRESTMITETDGDGETPVYNDPTTPDGRPTIENYIKKIFAVSDNDAFNRLYEFLGPEYINRELHKRGYQEAEIVHRLSLSLTPEQNRHTNPVKFYDASNKLLYQQASQTSSENYPPRSESLGKGYIEAGLPVARPMDFAIKNRISLSSLHHILRSVLFPESVPVSERFNLDPEDYDFLKETMSSYPAETGIPLYQGVEFYNSYGKYLYCGADRSVVPPVSTRIFNKIGGAYGFLLDVAYFADFENRIEFMLSAVIYCNSNGILNDDQYDYDTIGYPFLKHLGEVIYSEESQRPKEHLPDLSAFRYTYGH